MDGYPSLGAHVGALFGILAVSSTACSFPSLSNRFASLRLPSALFFIGKHFGTGVILSTAFVHLLQDAFENLNHPSIPKAWRKSTGAIVLVSLLVIFLVEYVSTVFVERSEQKAFEPARPPPLLYRDDPEDGHVTNADADGSLRSEDIRDISEHFHNHDLEVTRFFEGHHRHESPDKHQHERSGRRSRRATIVVDDQVSIRKQIVGILILQIGIMLHSLVIGTTLAISVGSEFTSLLIAVIFHQLFEGLSLGVRISTLPNTHTHLRVVLCLLFAIAMPIGMIVGLTVWPHAQHRSANLMQGIMASTSAGMLIYAATVEMLAGDFVMDKEMKLSGVWKQTVGILSLLTGAAAMGILG